jgi:hypothetical protein
MNPESTTALFRAHATARLRGDTVEASRLAARIEPGQRVGHLLFLVSLLAEAVIEEYGSRPDASDLAAITKHLHDKYFETNPNFNALRAEAMIRAVCGDSVLLTEIPHSEQPAYLWAAIGELVEPDLTDAELTELFDRAEESGLECLTETFEETIRNHPRRGGRPDGSGHEAPTAEAFEAAFEAESSGSEATAATRSGAEPTVAEASEAGSAVVESSDPEPALAESSKAAGLSGAEPSAPRLPEEETR